MIKKMFLFLLFSAVSFAQTNGPRIFVEKADHDFGNIKEGTFVSHNFVIKNAGDDTLVIRDVRASCGCTAAAPEKNRLLPGESTVIKVEFNSVKREGMQRKHVYLFCNDKIDPEVRLSFVANVIANTSNDPLKQARMVLSDTAFDFGNIQEGSVVNAKISFRNEGTDILQIKNIQSSCSCAAVIPSGTSFNPGEEGSLRIEFDSTDKLGKNSKEVLLFTNDTLRPVQRILILANVMKKN